MVWRSVVLQWRLVSLRGYSAAPLLFSSNHRLSVQRHVVHTLTSSEREETWFGFVSETLLRFVAHVEEAEFIKRQIHFYLKFINFIFISYKNKLLLFALSSFLSLLIYPVLLVKPSHATPSFLILIIFLLRSTCEENLIYFKIFIFILLLSRCNSWSFLSFFLFNESLFFISKHVYYRKNIEQQQQQEDGQWQKQTSVLFLLPWTLGLQQTFNRTVKNKKIWTRFAATPEIKTNLLQHDTDFLPYFI